MGEISFSYNQAKNNTLLISKQNQGLGYLSTYFPFETAQSQTGLLNLYDYIHLVRNFLVFFTILFL
jgi:hypothetical protein